MSIGIVVDSSKHIFSSGMIQNAYFIKLCLESLGYVCEFLSFEKSPNNFHYKNISVTSINLELGSNFEHNKYKLIITLAAGFNKKEYDILKSFNVAVVSFLCGNHFMHDIENFVRGVDNGRSNFIGSEVYSDELWTIPCYKYAIGYLETIRKRPGFVVPHLWSPEILEESVKLTGKDASLLMYDRKVRNKTVNLLIVEPNIALFKNAWLPICSGEFLYKKTPEMINEVYAFNWPSNTYAGKMADSLSLGKKLRRFQRLPIYEILLHFNLSESMPIFVSHQVNNSLNYIYYECLYYGWPLVHNSKDLEKEGLGYYYEENNIDKCADAIVYAQKHHLKNFTSYVEKGRSYLNKIFPINSEASKTWGDYVKSVIINSK